MCAAKTSRPPDVAKAYRSARPGSQVRQALGRRARMRREGRHFSRLEAERETLSSQESRAAEERERKRAERSRIALVDLCFRAARFGRSKELHTFLGVQNLAGSLGKALDERGVPFILWLARSGQHIALRRVLKHLSPEDLNATVDQWDGRTALHEAVERGWPKCVKVLLECEANPEARDARQRTPLMLATMHGRKEIAGYLVAAGADPRSVDENGSNAIMWARRGERYGRNLHDPFFD